MLAGKDGDPSPPGLTRTADPVLGDMGRATWEGRMLGLIRGEAAPRKIAWGETHVAAASGPLQLSAKHL